MASERSPIPTNHSQCLRRSLRWVFLNRRTGRITVVQWPNISLSVFILASIALHTIHSMGAIEIFARVLADLAILIWAIDELLRGVNVFRRALGLAVLITTCISLPMQVH
jgi:hypothetical protein